jgi:Protein of unknown function (DUF2510)
VTDARPPGWYDEPSGDPALLRWWDGRSWTAVTRRRAPFETPPEDSPTSYAGPGGDLLDSDAAPRPLPRRGLLLGLVAAGVILLLLVVGLPSGGSRDDRLAESGPGRTGLVTPPEPAPTTPRPVSGRVVDRVARLSYDVLPGDWNEWDRDSFRGLLSTIGYYRITQESAPNAQTYWANVTSGAISPRVAVKGDLRGSALRLVDTLAGEYYPQHTRQQLAERALTVDGAEAYLVRYRAVFDPDRAEGYAAKSEEVAVLVVETGQPLLSALYVSLPDTVRTLWPAIDGLLSSVRIVR